MSRAVRRRARDRRDRALARGGEMLGEPERDQRVETPDEPRPRSVES